MMLSLMLCPALFRHVTSTAAVVCRIDAVVDAVRSQPCYNNQRVRTSAGNKQRHRNSRQTCIPWTRHDVLPTAYGTAKHAHGLLRKSSTPHEISRNLRTREGIKTFVFSPECVLVLTLATLCCRGGVELVHSVLLGFFFFLPILQVGTSLLQMEYSFTPTGSRP